MSVTVKHGDKYPITFTANMDLTGSTVRLIVTPTSGTAIVLSASVTNAVGGVVTHTLDGTLPVGAYKVELEVTQGGSIVTFPTSQQAPSDVTNPGQQQYEMLYVIGDQA